jgi:benzodiazapine receptor
MRPAFVRELARLVVSVAIPLAAGGIGSIATYRSVTTWYPTLQKASFNPPGWLFGPVWTTLYVMMGIALFLVWRKGLAFPLVKTGLVLFAVQMALNALWSIAFFGMRSPAAGLVVVVLLWVALVLTMITFFRISVVPGLLFVPYFLWVSFASVLNGTIWWLNR